jgi:hypothetical protein
VSAGSCLEGTEAVSFDVRAQAWIFDWFGQDFDGAPKGSGDPAFYCDQLDKIHGGCRIELGHKINVAIVFGVATGDGAEQRKVVDTGLAQFRLVRPQGRYHLLGKVGLICGVHSGYPGVSIARSSACRIHRCANVFCGGRCSGRLD